MWEQAKSIVESVFFKDTVQLYELTFTQNDLGEDIEVPVFVGAYNCNIENQQSQNKRDISGESTPQMIRVSTVKSIPLSYGKTYQLQITSARIAFTNEKWKVEGWTEAQLSTVITASREVVI